MTAKERNSITKVRGGWVAVWESTAGSPRHRVVERGEVVFQGDRILYAGPCYEGHVDHVIDRPEWFICPGFINLHGHVGVEMKASIVDVSKAGSFAPGPDFVKNAPTFMWPTLTPEEQRLSGEISLVQMLRTGTTTVVDAHGYGPLWWLGNPPTDEAYLAETVGRIGSRAYLALGFRSARSYQKPDGTRDWHWDEEMGVELLQAGLRFAEEHHMTHDGRVQVILCPHAVDNNSPALLKMALKEARARDLRIEIHVSQSLNEVDLVQRLYGDTPVGHLNNIGFLGPDITLGHCIFISGHPDVGGDPDLDLKMIADAGSSVAHSPLPFARRGIALHTLPRYLDHGVNVGIGCDVWPVDIIEEMRLAWFLGKHTNGTAGRPTCMEVFTAATVGSADAMGRDDLGRLAPGARADMVCVDMSGYHFGPVLDPVRSLVAFGKGQDVDMVFVDGRPVVEGGSVLNADEDALRAAAPGILYKLAQVASERDPMHRTIESILSLEV